MLKLKLIYDRWSVSKSVLVSHSHLKPTTRVLFSVWHFRVSWCGAPSLMRDAIASGSCQKSHSWVQVPQNSGPYFTASYVNPPTWRAKCPYLYPPGTRWPSHLPGTGFPFCHLLGLIGLWWMYSNPSPHAISRSRSYCYIVTVGQSASLSWCRAPFGAGDQMLHFFEWQLLFYFFM
jgi:hypothetical protein